MNPSKVRGTRYESALVTYFRDRGFARAERRALSGTQDKGDLIGISDHWTFEAKDHQTIDLAGFLDQAKTEALNAGTPNAAAIIKRRRKPVAESYVVMTLDQFATLLLSGELGESP